MKSGEAVVNHVNCRHTSRFRHVQVHIACVDGDRLGELENIEATASAH
jgi:hypothetical protein